MISFIKMSCGPQFTKKLEGMLTDLTLASEEAKKYEEHTHNLASGADAISNIDFQVKILTTSYWPTYNMQELIIPRDLDPSMRSFQHYY